MAGGSRGGSDPAGAIDAAPAAPLCVVVLSTAHAGLVVASARSAPHRCDSLRAALSSFHRVSVASRSLCPAAFSASHLRARRRITFAAFTSASSTCAHRMQRNAFPLRFSASTCPHSASVRLESMAGSFSATPPGGLHGVRERGLGESPQPCSDTPVERSFRCHAAAAAASGARSHPFDVERLDPEDLVGPCNLARALAHRVVVAVVHRAALRAQAREGVLPLPRASNASAHRTLGVQRLLKRFLVLGQRQRRAVVQREGVGASHVGAGDGGLRAGGSSLHVDAHREVHLDPASPPASLAYAHPRGAHPRRLWQPVRRPDLNVPKPRKPKRLGVDPPGRGVPTHRAASRALPSPVQLCPRTVATALVAPGARAAWRGVSRPLAFLLGAECVPCPAIPSGMLHHPSRPRIALVEQPRASCPNFMRFQRFAGHAPPPPQDVRVRPRCPQSTTLCLAIR